MERKCELVIIGGGTNGPAILLTALLSGIKNAALIERGKIGKGKNLSAANYAATGLIQPGAKYLASDWRLVNTDALDCRLLKAIAGDLLKETPFIMPTFKDYALPYSEPAFLDFYFGAYDEFSRIALHPAHRRLSKEEVLNSEPGLKEKIWGGVLFYEWVTNPPELSLAFAEAAKKLGGVIMEQSEVVGFETRNTRDGKIIESAIVRRSDSGTEEEVKAHYFINACGAWSPKVAGFLGLNLKLRPTKGTSIALNKRLSTNAIILFDRYGCYSVILPQGEITLVGPTNKEISEDEYRNPDKVRSELCEKVELLQIVNDKFKITVSENNIVWDKCGLRSQLNHQSVLPYDITHQSAIFDHKKDGVANIISLVGGKLSAQLQMARETVQLACKDLGIKFFWGIPGFTLDGKPAAISISPRDYKRKKCLKLFCDDNVDETIFSETLTRKFAAVINLCKYAIRHIYTKLTKKGGVND